MNKLIYWLPAMTWMGVIYFLSARTAGEIKSMFPFLQNLNPGHILAYFILSALFFFAVTKSTTSRSPYSWSMLLSVVYGISDEYHQSLVPGRAPEIQDLMRDALGAAAALLLIYIFNKRKKQKLQTDSE